MGAPGVPIWNRAAAFLLLGLVFVLVRLNVVLHDPHPSIDDTLAYANLMIDRELGARRDVAFYDAHARLARYRTARSADKSGAGHREEVEYPPLALAFIRLPTVGITPLPAEQNPPRKRAGFLPTPEQDYAREYGERYTFWILPVELCLAALVWAFCRRLYPRDRTALVVAGLVYLTSTAALWQFLYTRLDLVVSLLTAASLFLLVSRAHFVWSFAVLALAVNFKVVPVVLAPVWVLGALPAGAGPDLFRRRTLRPVGVRFVVLLALTAGVFFPFYLTDGPGTLNFLDYHAGRGLEVGSVYSYLLMWVAELGGPLEVYFSHGGYNVRSPLSSFLVAASPVVCGAALLAAYALAAAALRLAAGSGPAPPPGTTLARAHPLLFVRITLLVLVVFILTNKVFSPQYLLWLIPFACLLPRRHPADRLCLFLFPAVCAATGLIFPLCFWHDVVGLELLPDESRILRGPTTTGLLLLTLRNVLLVGLLVSLVWGIRRADDPPPLAERPVG